MHEQHSFLRNEKRNVGHSSFSFFLLPYYSLLNGNNIRYFNIKKKKKVIVVLNCFLMLFICFFL